MNFASFLKDKRIERGLTLRQCCLELEVDPSNWSKMERGINPAPKDQELLRKWAEFFCLDFAATEQFFDLAALSRSEIPQDLASDEKVLAMLPVFFRAARNDFSREKLNSFIEDIRQANSPDKQ